jgi:hypothetical protein
VITGRVDGPWGLSQPQGNVGCCMNMHLKEMVGSRETSLALLQLLGDSEMFPVSQHASGLHPGF